MNTGGTGNKTVIIDNTSAGYQQPAYGAYGQPPQQGYGYSPAPPPYDPAYNMANQHAQPYYGGDQGPYGGYPQQGYPQQGYGNGPVMQ